MQTEVQFWSNVAQLFFKREMFQKKFVMKMKTHVLYIHYRFSRKTVSFSAIMWKNMVEPDRPQVTT